MRLIGFFFLTIGGGGCGFYMAYRLTERVKQLRQLYQLLLMLQGEIRYQNSLLQEAFMAMAGRLLGWQNQFLEEISLQLKNQTEKTMEQLWCEEVRKLPDYTSFSEEEVKLLLELGGQLGYLDREMQLTTLEFYKKRVIDLIEELERQKTEKCRLYRVLGVASGMFVALLLL